MQAHNSIGDSLEDDLRESPASGQFRQLLRLGLGLIHPSIKVANGIGGGTVHRANGVIQAFVEKFKCFYGKSTVSI